MKKLSDSQLHLLSLLRDGKEIEVSYNTFDYGARVGHTGRVHMKTFEALLNRGLLDRVPSREKFPRTSSYVLSDAGKAIVKEHWGSGGE